MRVFPGNAIAAVPAGDILDGAEAIAAHLFNDVGKRRRIYYLAEQGGLPIFRIGSRIMARRSTLAEWIAAQERLGGTAR